MKNLHAEKSQPDQGIADQVKQHFKAACEQYENFHEKVDDVSKVVIAKTKKKPLLALGVAVTIGVLLGKILK